MKYFQTGQLEQSEVTNLPAVSTLVAQNKCGHWLVSAACLHLQAHHHEMCRKKSITVIGFQTKGWKKWPAVPHIGQKMAIIIMIIITLLKTQQFGRFTFFSNCNTTEVLGSGSLRKRSFRSHFKIKAHTLPRPALDESPDMEPDRCQSLWLSTWL